MYYEGYIIVGHLVNIYTVFTDKVTLKIEYHGVGDTWWQPLLSYGKWCTEFKIGSFILLILSTVYEHDKQKTILY